MENLQENENKLIYGIDANLYSTPKISAMNLKNPDRVFASFSYATFNRFM